jgi:hypothetical protein
LVWAHRLGDGRRLRRCCRLKPSARYKPSRRGPFISSVGRGRRGQAAHNCCHSGCSLEWHSVEVARLHLLSSLPSTA